MEGNGGAAGLTLGAASARNRPREWGGAAAGALVATLGQPRWWAIALASFLVRGGIVVVVLPIMTLPTVATLSSLASPTIVAIAFGSPPPGMVATYTLAGTLLAAWAALAAVVGAWLDLELVDEVAREEDLDLNERPAGRPLRRAIAVRLVPHAGTVLATTYAAIRLVVEAYGEILSPGDAAVPLVWRIILRAPDGIAVLGAAWLAGEAIGGLAVRRVAAGSSASDALLDGLRRLITPAGLATLAVTSVGVALAVVPLWLVAARAWDQARVLLVDGAPVLLLLPSLVLFVVTWALGLAILAVGLAWRAAAWSVEAGRARGDRASEAASKTLPGA
ncbi:MAG TPA: hypothetical protein VK831_03015 [Candidatus Deferrimicrobiaceae bacterium]|nr:hypothetical protein [Candidatus Deferrimicrobiaceae bacterium]